MDHPPQQGTAAELDLPPGFRFFPMDEEIVINYLAPKVLDPSFTAMAIAEVDLNRVEPWELPAKAKLGEGQWYFYFQKDRKYPTGMRTNRATAAGYWKATGKDKEIYRYGADGGELVGMKKTLVFYRGRAPKGEKTDWVMHEYRLDGALPFSPSDLVRAAAKEEWVVCRVFNKSGGKKDGGAAGEDDEEMGGGGSTPEMPGLMDAMSYGGGFMPSGMAAPSTASYFATMMGMDGGGAFLYPPSVMMPTSGMQYAGGGAMNQQRQPAMPSPVATGSVRFVYSGDPGPSTAAPAATRSPDGSTVDYSWRLY